MVKTFNIGEYRLNSLSTVISKKGKYKPGDRVVVEEGSEDGGDDWAIGLKGVVVSFEDGYYEVELKGKGRDTFMFGEYQLKKG